ncbi:MAG TPA: hypothetical protein VLV48_09510, partial [Thermoanaerobaculia bacterium]|nr:hypothetical protein [Thermoanaerobaculia bacterium]
RVSIVALDAQAKTPFCRVRAEYVLRSPLEGGNEPLRRSGWHITSLFDAGELSGVALTPFARYEMAGDEREETTRAAAGLNATFLHSLVLKLEYQRTLDEPEDVRSTERFRRDSWSVQAVIVF